MAEAALLQMTDELLGSKSSLGQTSALDGRSSSVESIIKEAKGKDKKDEKDTINEARQKTKEEEKPKKTENGSRSDVSNSGKDSEEMKEKTTKKKNANKENKTKTKKEEDWVKYHKGLKQSMIRPRLKEGVTNKDAEMLRRAIQDAENAAMKSDDADLVKAKHTLQVLDKRKKLLDAMEKKDVKTIEKEVKTINANLGYYATYYNGIQREVYEAQRLVEDLQRAKAKEAAITVKLDRNTLSAIRNFKKPPPEVHRVMQGALLLLQHDTNKTSRWDYVTSTCTTETLKRMMDYDVSQLHPDIAATARSILREQTFNKLQSISQAAATLYVWGMGTADECHQLKGKGNTVNVRRQRQIFFSNTDEGNEKEPPRNHKQTKNT